MVDNIKLFVYAEGLAAGVHDFGTADTLQGATHIVPALM